MPTDLRFDQFVDGGDIIPGDIIVGLRVGLNTFFNAGTVASQNANNVNFTGGILSNITSIQSSVIVIGNSLVTVSNDVLAHGNANDVSNSDNAYTIGSGSCTIIDSDYGGIINATNSTLDNSDYSLVFTGDGHTFTNAANAIGGGVGAVSVTHAGGMTFSSRFGGTLASRTNFQWVVDAENGFVWLGAWALTTMHSEIPSLSMDNETYSFYTSTTGPIIKWKTSTGAVGKSYLTPQTKDTVTALNLTGDYTMSNPVAGLYQLEFTGAGLYVILPKADDADSPYGVFIKIYNVGLEKFGVKDYSGIILIPVANGIPQGASQTLRLTNNSTPGGSWSADRLGTAGAQQSNAVAFTGGTITGLTSLGASGVALTSGTITGITSLGASGVNLTSGTITGMTSIDGTTIAGGAVSASTSLTLSRNGSGATALLTTANTSNTASSKAGHLIQVAGPTADDPYTQWSISGVTTFTMGLDNSDSDKLKIAASSTLGTNDILTISSSTDVTWASLRISQEYSYNAGVVLQSVVNTSTSGAGATLLAQTNGAGGGDPAVMWTVNGVTNYMEGIDNSDGDKFKRSIGTALGTNDAMVMTNAGAHTYPLQPSFSAYVQTTINDVTGAGAVYAMIFGTVLFDRASNYNPATGVFTAPVTGIFMLGGVFTLANVGGSSYSYALVTTGGTYQLQIGNPSGERDAGANLSRPGFALAPMTAGDTAYLVIYVNGMAGNTADVLGVSGAPYNTFWGYLVA